jgi:hypothetical protein
MELPILSSSSDEAMSLYAAGFNAWNQLNFEPSPTDEEPDDLFTFTKVLASKAVGHIAPKISYTAGKYHGFVMLLITTLICGSAAK